MIVGLTGGIATGKSTVTNMFRSLDAYVVDADVWARRVVEPGSDGLAAIVQAFGPGTLRENGELNRQALADIIFHDHEARRRLNDITHPRVRQGMQMETQEYLARHRDKPVLWDVPLLFEGATRSLVDKTIVVYVDEPTQLLRLMQRNQLTEDEACARIQSQMPIEEKRQQADFVIDNRGTLEHTKEQVQEIWRVLQTFGIGDGPSLS